MRRAFLGALILASGNWLITPVLAFAAPLSGGCPAIARTLQLDSKGDDVKQLQQFLLQQGVLKSGSVSGYFDLITQQALQKYQSGIGIVSTGTPATTGWGIAGEKTRQAIAACTHLPVKPVFAAPIPAPRPAPAPAPVRAPEAVSRPSAMVQKKGTRTLSRGMRGDDVVEIQNRLVSEGLLERGSATGFFGAQTEAAVRKFQTSRGIVSSGTPSSTGFGAVGPKTRISIMTGAKPNEGASMKSEDQPKAAGAWRDPHMAPPLSEADGDAAAQKTSPTAPPGSCVLNGVTVVNGTSTIAYQTSSVPFGTECLSESRTCRNGTLSGTYQFISCSVGAGNSCMFNGKMVVSGTSVTAYKTADVPYGTTCVSESRACANGTLSGTYAYDACTVRAGLLCYMNGQTVTHGSTVTAYLLPSVSYGRSCTSQSRTCTNGVLSGSYQFHSCTVEPMP